MRRLFTTLSLLLVMTIASAQETIDRIIDRGLDRATSQTLLLAQKVKEKPYSFPQTYENGKFRSCDKRWWVCGFFPGTLWYLYENQESSISANSETKGNQEEARQLLGYAKEFTMRCDSVKYVTDNHDVGFMINCSFGNGYRITHDPYYKSVLETAAKSLSGRFNKTIGCTQSWARSRTWQFPVIIDNMMNLELLADWGYKDIATTHANTTLKNHFRPDYSCYHVVSYDTITGKPHAKCTAQGYADGSAWARGQGWALYGYTMMFRETGDSAYLRHAVKVARYIASRLPEDGIPYWDFDDPRITGYTMPNEKSQKYLNYDNPVPRDASAAAIYASALVELSKYVPYQLSQQYIALAEKILRTLTSDEYLAKPGEMDGFILKHSTGNLPEGSEVDVPLTYADYYYVEALMRLKELRASQGQRDRAYWVEKMTQIARPVLQNVANGTIHQNMPYESLEQKDAARKQVCFLEAFGRTMLGLAPWLELKEDQITDENEKKLHKEFLELARKACSMAVDPKNPDKVLFYHEKCSQPLVDAAFYAQGLLTAKTQLWDKFDKKTKKNTLAALLESRQIHPYQTNWLLFASTVEAAIMELSSDSQLSTLNSQLKCDTARLMKGIKNFQTQWYKGDGVYGDGMEFHYDYYNSIVIHSLLVSPMRVAVKHGLIPESELILAEQRMGRYAQILERLISPEGTYPVTGRSITYRTAHFYALSQAALDHLYTKNLPYGQARTALTAVMHRQLEAPGTFTSLIPQPSSLNPQGWLTIGFCGHQPHMSEKYINTGSEYMVTSVFVALGLPSTDAFWTDPYMEWSNLKAWQGIDIGADHALCDLKKCEASKKNFK